MLLRCLVIVFISGGVLFGWALWQESAQRKTPLWQGLVIVLACIMFMVSSAILVVLAYAFVLGPFAVQTGSPWDNLIFLPGLLLGAWCASLGTQLLANAARRVLGKPAQKLELFRKPARKKRKKAAAPKPSQH